MIPNASALGPHEPNYEIYPFIDAQMYDQLAQTVLIGDGFDGSIPPRALYITFLSFMHMIVGQDYESLVFLQTLVFALFPMQLYIFGRYYFGRPVGVSIALLAIFRDLTSNLVSPFTGNLSYSKVFMSELPTAMFLVLLLILCFKWIKTEFPLVVSFFVGSVLGLAMLIRTQTVVILPMLIVFSVLIHPHKIRRLLVSSLAIFLSVLLVISPWLWRNWYLTGNVIFDSPEYQISNLALRYSRLNGIEPNIMALPGESYSEYNDRLKEMSIDAIRFNPQLALWGVTNTFLNHSINNILLMPLRYEIVDLGDFWIPEDAFWEEWVGRPSTLQTFLLMFYVLLFGMGVSTVWHRHGMLGLLPLGVNLAYNFWTSLALLSGQRFMVSMDWSIYFYYMVGFFALIGGAGMLFKRGNVLVRTWIRKYFCSNIEFAPYTGFSMFSIVGFGFIFLIVGSSPVLIERIFSKKYPILSNAQVLSDLLNTSSVQQVDIAMCLDKLDQQGMLTYVQGRVLYPRYYDAGDGERFTDAIGYRVVDEDRIVFEFIGQRNGRVIMPVLIYPDFFPHASDATLVYGTDANPWFIFVKKGEDERFYVSKDFTFLICE